MSAFIAAAVTELIAIEKAVREIPGGADPDAFRARVRDVVILTASHRAMRDLQDIETAIYRTQGEA